MTRKSRKKAPGWCDHSGAFCTFPCKKDRRRGGVTGAFPRLFPAPERASGRFGKGGLLPEAAELPELEEFNGDNNQIKVIPDFDEEASPLWRFSVNHNEIESLEGLAGIDNLNFVLADYNKIKDITVLESCRLLCQLDVWDNPIDQDGVKTLQDGGVIVNFNKNYKEDTAE